MQADDEDRDDTISVEDFDDAPSQPPQQPAAMDVTYKLQLDRLSHATNGVVTHRFSASAMLDSLELSRNMRPGASLSAVLSASATLLLGEPGRDVASDIQRGVYALPSISVLRAARVRLDIMSILFSQFNWLRGRVVHYGQLDSSPQLGYNMLAAIEETFVIPDVHSLTPHIEIEKALSFTRETMQLSTLGMGKAGLLKKSINYVNLQLMKTGSIDKMEEKRKRYRGIVSDQGTEKGAGDMGIAIVPALARRHGPESSDAFVFPGVISMPGFLHILYDALENCTKKNQGYKSFLDVLQITETFLNTKHIVQRYQEVCLTPGTPEHKLFNTGARCHVDWKWEFLSNALVQQLPKYRVLQSHFDVDKMLRGDAGVLSNLTVTNMDKARKDEDWEAIAYAYLCIGKQIEGTAKDLEICDCHALLWKGGQRLTRKRRRRKLQTTIGARRCPWMGRRLAWFIADGYGQLVLKIQTATSDELAAKLATMPIERRTNVVAIIDELRQDLVEQLSDKFGFLFHIPYVAVGSFHAVQGVSLLDAHRPAEGGDRRVR